MWRTVATACLGYMYQMGQGTGVIDYSKAKYWYEKAAEQGDEDAKNNLANLENDLSVNSKSKESNIKNGLQNPSGTRTPEKSKKQENSFFNGTYLIIAFILAFIIPPVGVGMFALALIFGRDN